eukprot:1137668-Pelagomonas_calceolata.AAC.2
MARPEIHNLGKVTLLYLPTRGAERKHFFFSFLTQKHAIRFNHTSDPTAAFAATCVASITLSSDAHTQHAKRCFQTDATLPSVSAVKPSAKVNMAHSLLPWTLAV